MLDKSQAIAIYKELETEVLGGEDWFKNIASEISAILLYGSVAKGTNHAKSDIDILIILPLEIEQKYTKGEYFYEFNGYIINIVLRSIEKIRQIAKDQSDKFQKEVFSDSIIIHSKDETLSLLLDQIKLI